MAMIEEIWDHAGQTLVDRHPDLRGQSCWCVDCGEPAAAEALTWWHRCARCAQWWRDNPPPGPQYGEVNDTPEIAAIRARWQAATRGPWRDWSYSYVRANYNHIARFFDDQRVMFPNAGANAVAIAAAPSDIATLLAALDEAQAQIARDAPVIAAAEALGAARVRRLRAMPDDVDIGEFAAADTAYGKALESLSSTLAHRAATTPTP